MFRNLATELLATFGLGLCDITPTMSQWRDDSNVLICILRSIGSVSGPSALWWFLYSQGYPCQAEDKVQVWPSYPAKFKDWNRDSQSLLGKGPHGSYEIQRGVEEESIGNSEGMKTGVGSVTPSLLFPRHLPPPRLPCISQVI